MSESKFTVDKDNLEVRIEKIFNCTPERLWQAHTDPSDIEKWWSGTKVEIFELKVGGKWRFIGTDDNSNNNFRGEFLELNKPNKITRTFEYEPMAGHVMEETVTFEALPDGKTKQSTISKYSNLDDLNGMVNSGMEYGAKLGLERLAKVVE